MWLGFEKLDALLKSDSVRKIYVESGGAGNVVILDLEVNHTHP